MDAYMLCTIFILQVSNGICVCVAMFHAQALLMLLNLCKHLLLE